ncbi:NAD-dependent protein deacetylase of SIR2 family [Kineococcus sp. SYSU DK006]|uniref:NAD-dependent protein deacetylase of SIR2 family n=1 Tax=Kineococcus sp. SYSU DK006 TaxID=3383127 RepID=UPI003D7E05C6
MGLDAALEQAATWLAQADKILLTAGAGLSAAAGFDYTDTQTFARVFPGFAARGYQAQYQMIGRPLPPQELWGYWLTHAQYVRFSPGPNPTYTRLRSLIGQADHFVYTSNVDALFARNGFAPDRVFSPQGDYAYYQCTGPCTRQVWSTRDLIDRLLPLIDPATGAITATSDQLHAAGGLPRCPACGGPVFLNVRIDASFIVDHFLPTGQQLQTWLNTDPDARVVVLEIGAGFNTPSVIRWPGERITAALPRARLIRINPKDAGVPEQLADRALGLPVDAGHALDALGAPAGGSTLPAPLLVPHQEER